MIFLFLAVALPIPVRLVYCLIHGVPFKPMSLDAPIKEVQQQPVLQDGDQTADSPAV